MSSETLWNTLLSEYLLFLKDAQNLSPATISIRRNYLSSFLSHSARLKLSPSVNDLSPHIIHDYVIAAARSKSRASCKHLVSSLRSFLRFAHIKGYVPLDLVETVPVIAIRKLEGLPRAIAWDDVQKLLAAPDRSVSAGRRDYAILLLLARYGVRISQVTQLLLRDIDWHSGVITFKALKGGKSLRLPLQADVAEALLDYLARDRGTAVFPQLFLTVRGQRRPLSRDNHLNSSLQVYYRRAGIESITQGAHAIRHAFAARLIQGNTPIKLIADLLGHRSINTTFIYTKVDIERLRSLAVEWPQEVL